MALQALSQGTPTAASQLPFYDPQNGADRRASLAQLAEVLQELLASSGQMVSQYAAPSATGFGVQVAPFTEGGSVFLLLTPAAAYAAGTVTLPAVASCTHGQEVLVHSTQAVTALTVAGNGASVVSGAPTTLAAGGSFRLRFDAVLQGWYRAG